MRDAAFASPNLEGEHECPCCLGRFDTGDIMHIAVGNALRGDPILGEDAQQRFLATRFNNSGHALDAMGYPCLEKACPHCRRKLPGCFLDMPHHIISLVGDQSAGKSYFLSVMIKLLAAALPRDFHVVFRDSDPSGNAPLNDLRMSLFSARTPEEAILGKTVFEGAMYDHLPRQGRMVAMPRPFIYKLEPEDKVVEPCALIFYDNAGEHFQPGVNIVEKPGAQHVASAAGIVYLFDPFNSPEFRRSLLHTNDPQMENQVLDRQDTILAEMGARIQAIRNLRSGEPITTPVAFVVGKCDAWLQLLNGKPLRDPSPHGRLNKAAIEENSNQVRALMHELCPAVVANAEALSTNVMYFAASSFGHTPVKIGPRKYAPDPRRFQPVHVEVPLLWILSQISAQLVSTDCAHTPPAPA